MELTQSPRTGDFILSLATRTRSLENGILGSGQAAATDAGTVLGQGLAAGAATAVGTPAGNGAITVGAIGPAAEPGVYKLVLVTVVANAGTFNFYAPDGSLVRQITVGGGVADNDHIAITIADGAVDFAAGDTFAIEVATGNYSPLNPAATDGTQIAAGILYAGANAISAAAAVVAVARDAEVKADALIWPVGISTADRTAAIGELNDRGIFLR